MIDKWLVDIRDFAYILERKQSGNPNRYKDKLVVVFTSYYMCLCGALLYCVRAFYDLPFINYFKQSNILVKAIISICIVYLPFRIVDYFLDRRYRNIPLPAEDISKQLVNRKKKVFWIALGIGVILFGLIAYGAKIIRSVVDGPIF